MNYELTCKIAVSSVLRHKSTTCTKAPIVKSDRGTCVDERTTVVIKSNVDLNLNKNLI